jgi:hypothetical protein
VRSSLQATISSLCNNLLQDALYSAAPHKLARFNRDLVGERLKPIVTAKSDATVGTTAVRFAYASPGSQDIVNRRRNTEVWSISEVNREAWECFYIAVSREVQAGVHFHDFLRAVVFLS